ncbi:MAG: hypothetical protein A2Z34_02355 [Planctomycetes bacterium RBG_16_59_8]|nr:MAG: hypothetical protein A2Z34_02355 [Planctomycetes bacterium RBG_16_59_8]
MRRTFVIAALFLFSLVAGCQGPQKQTAEEAYEVGMYWYQRARYDRAFKKFTDALDLRPTYTEALLGLANAAREMGNEALLKKDRANGDRYHEYAKKALIEQIKKTPSDARLSYGLGQLYYERFSNIVAEFASDERAIYQDAAITYFRKAVELDPMNVYVNKYLGLLLIKRTKEDVPEGKRLLTKYLEDARASLAEMLKRKPRDEIELKYREDLRNQIDDIAAILRDLP